MSNVIKSRKAAVIGCGFVGSATAFTLMQSKLFSELVLLDVNTGKADGEAKDISHGVPFAAPMKIYAGDYDDVADAAIIIVTAGANQKPDETRLDLVHRNVEIYKSIIPEIASRNFGGILLIVSNPVDILTGTIVVENVFAWPGLGTLCISSIFNRDYPVIQTYVLLIGVLFVVFNLLFDILQTVSDPRMRKEGN